MTISDSIPVQFWIVGYETFNEEAVCGLVKQDCFCAPWLCTDEITLQIQAANTVAYYLVVSSEDAVLLVQKFSAISMTVQEISFTMTENGICNKQVVLKIIRLSPVWTSRSTSGADKAWLSIAYGNSLYVAVAQSTGTDANVVMTSSDGLTWTLRTASYYNVWASVCFGNDLFVAVASSATGNPQVMTSLDGITWTARVAAAANDWQSVTCGNGLFVAVSTGGASRVMTSPDGITWTARSAAAANQWYSICYGNGLFVAVAWSGAGNRVMTSPDGITWTSRTSAANNQWTSVVYGSGVFVAVSNTGVGNRVMTSSDGITWTSRSSAADNDWNSVAYGDGIFIAVASSGSGNRVMTSLNGIIWTIGASAADNQWFGIGFGNHLFVGVSLTGSANRVMTATPLEAQSDCLDVRTTQDCTKLIEYTNSSNFDGIDYSDFSPGNYFRLRIPAVFNEEKNPQEQEDLELSNGVIVTLRNQIQQKTLLETGYMPNYMHLKLQKILMHETIIIDSTQWKKRDSYDDSPVKKYNLKKAQVYLTKYNSVEKNTI